MSAPPTILVFDSGLGGLTVLREIVQARPDAHYIYVADDAFFPYGHHGEEQIIARVVPLVGELIAIHRPDLVVIACNTASTLVMSHLRAAYKVPFVGTVPTNGTWYSPRRCDITSVEAVLQAITTRSGAWASIRSPISGTTRATIASSL